MQACFAIKGFCETGFMNRLSGNYRRPEFIANTLGLWPADDINNKCFLPWKSLHTSCVVTSSFWSCFWLSSASNGFISGTSTAVCNTPSSGIYPRDISISSGIYPSTLSNHPVFAGFFGLRVTCNRGNVRHYKTQMQVSGQRAKRLATHCNDTGLRYRKPYNEKTN